MFYKFLVVLRSHTNSSIDYRGVFDSEEEAISFIEDDIEDYMENGLQYEIQKVRHYRY